MSETPNHEYNVPAEGERDWHEPLNENFEAHDTDIEIRDVAANRGDYDPKQGAKFFATDTGQVYLGTGSGWDPVEHTGSTPTFESVSTTGSASFDGFVAVGTGDEQINSSEALGVRTSTDNGVFGGMYVDATGSAAGRPYYGYAVEGSSEAWHYYDGATDEWVLSNRGEVLRVGQDGGVELNGARPRVHFENATQRFAGPIAYGSVERDATLQKGTPNVASTTFDGDRYLVGFDDFDYNFTVHTATVQLRYASAPDRSARVASYDDSLAVYVRDRNDDPVRQEFHFAVFQP